MRSFHKISLVNASVTLVSFSPLPSLPGISLVHRSEGPGSWRERFEDLAKGTVCRGLEVKATIMKIHQKHWNTYLAIILNIMSLEVRPDTRVTGFVFGQSITSRSLPLTTKEASPGGTPATHNKLSYGYSSKMIFIDVKHTYKVRVK